MYKIVWSVSEKMKRFFSNEDLKKLIVPLIIDQFLQAFVGLADSIMVASVGEAAVSGVSLIDTVMVLIINIFTALATGGAVIAGQFIGKQKEAEACKATNQLLLFTVKASVVVMALGYLGRNVILHGIFGKIDADVMYNCNIYLLIVFASIPMIAVYNAGAAIFRSMGNSTIAMITSLIMNAVNLGGNAVLIYGCHRGIEGVAIPTLVSRCVAAAIILVLLNNQSRQIHIFHPFCILESRTVWKTVCFSLEKFWYSAW